MRACLFHNPQVADQAGIDRTATEQSLVVGLVKAWEAGERAIPEFTKSNEERVVA
jgi:hypothetical protein